MRSTFAHARALERRRNRRFPEWKEAENFGSGIKVGSESVGKSVRIRFSLEQQQKQQQQQQLQKSNNSSKKANVDQSSDWLSKFIFRQKRLKAPKKSKNGSRPRHLDLRRQPGHRPEPGFRFWIRISDQAGSSLRSQSSGWTGPLHLRRPDFAISNPTFSSYKSKSPVLLRCGLLGIWQSCKPRVRILPPPRIWILIEWILNKCVSRSLSRDPYLFERGQ